MTVLVALFSYAQIHTVTVLYYCSVSIMKWDSLCTL